MRAIRAIATSAVVTLIAAVVVSACTSGSDGQDDPQSSSSTAEPTSSAIAVSSPITSPDTTPTSGDSTTPSAPMSSPTVPADVPTVGHNSRPGEKPPVEPIVALAHTPAGAKAFAVFFMKALDWGYATTSGAYIRHYFTQSCVACVAIAGQFAKDSAAGVRYIGGRIQPGRVRLASRPYVKAANYTVLVGCRIGAMEKETEGGHFYSPTKKSTATFDVSVAWSTRGWHVAELEVTL